ncbi:hypothetical protein CBR_g68728 [Chara braunii]|uniref:DUF4360 domain-containing protein n=1 Tax=Chara braunii TaxID=69332 RepID=A0A388K9Y0_CHABU|nr:hypothetical protein CBR_g68728 [Chara braunii]|eukprot:GBG66743.1 hypothetical protein CBR_g68728 [Chara braunii]
MARSLFPVVAAMAAVVVVSLLSAAVPASAKPPKVTIESVTFMGSGCNWQNTNYVLSNDYSTVTFIFGDMIATTDGGLANRRKNCQASLGLKYPKGWSLSLGSVTGRGYGKLDKGVEGTYQTSYYFSGQTGTAYAKRTLNGQLELNYEYTDVFGLLVWSQCNNVPNLNINSEVRVDGPAGRNGIMTLDSTDKKFKLIYRLNWKTC